MVSSKNFAKHAFKDVELGVTSKLHNLQTNCIPFFASNISLEYMPISKILVEITFNVLQRGQY
jgi:hypothetical protein